MGELASGNCWEAYYNNTAEVAGTTYLANYEAPTAEYHDVSEDDWPRSELSSKHNIASWRPAHSLHDQ